MKVFSYLSLVSARFIHLNPNIWQSAGENNLQSGKLNTLNSAYIEKSRKIARKNLKSIQNSRKTAKTRTIAFNPANCSYKDMREQLLGVPDTGAHCNGWKFDKYSHTYVTFHQTKH